MLVSLYLSIWLPVQLYKLYEYSYIASLLIKKSKNWTHWKGIYKVKGNKWIRVYTALQVDTALQEALNGGASSWLGGGGLKPPPQ